MSLPIENPIGRFTVQMDTNVYRAIKAVAPHLSEYVKGKNICTYELLNKILVLGIKEWSKTTVVKKHKININAPEFKNARLLAKECP